MSRDHHYKVNIHWTGNKGKGTSSYTEYERSHEIFVNDKPFIVASSDPAFRGDREKYNPEELLLASVASCHMLWYLHLCSDHKIIVTSYSDMAEAVMEENEAGGKFKSIVLKPEVSIADGQYAELAILLHEKANEKCFIANSLNFPVKHEPRINIKS